MLDFHRRLKLDVYGESHGPVIGMRLYGFPGKFEVDFDELQALLERRAPGRDPLSTSRREPDVPEFLSGFKDRLTTGNVIEAVIRNKDTKPGDYEKTIPRPGHADYPAWVKYGKIPSGGGAFSGRMTAPMCIAGGLCLQWLERERGIRVAASLVEVGGKRDGFDETISAAKLEGDSIGGIIEARAEGLPVGVGGPMFDGVESKLAAALFGVPGVKGVEFGQGFKLAEMRGSEANDPYRIQGGQVVCTSNNNGGLLGGMTDGMPLVVRVAMKPTPSIYKLQQSVDLVAKENAEFSVRGRHDPCIAKRAVPVVEALVGFVLMDLVLSSIHK